MARRSARGKVWGSDEVNVEGWKPLKRLVGHESGESLYAHNPEEQYSSRECSDVTDVAWSPGDRYLASVGLDSAVLVWCGYTLGVLFPSYSVMLHCERAAQNVYAKSTSTKVSSRACVGILSESFWRLALTIGPFEYGGHPTGSWRLRLRSPLITLLELSSGD